MKKCKKLLAFTLSVLLAFACYVVPAFASSGASQYGLEATLMTDKESYKANEEIHVTVTVKNTNDFKVEAVSIESLLPETLTLKDGSNSTKTVDLEPGETLTLSFTAVKEKEETSATEPESQSTEPTETETVLPSEPETVKPSETETVKPSESETVKPSETETQKPTQESTEQPTQGTTTPITTEPTAPATTTEGTTPAPSTTGTQPTTGGIIGDLATTFPKTTTPADSSTTAQAENPDTGDSMSVKTLAIAIIALFSVIAIVIILMYKYKKQTTQIISLVMCVAISASAITGVTFFTARGVDDGRKSFTVEKVITVDGEETNVGAEVKYQENKIDPDTGIKFIEFTTTSKPSDVVVGEKTNITFKAKISNPQSIPLDKIQVTDETGNEVGYLYDNGEKPDQNANDGVYTGTFELYSDREKEANYSAHINGASASQIIYFYVPLTREQLDEMDDFSQSIQKLTDKYTNSDGYIKEEQAKTLLNTVYDFCKKQQEKGIVKSYELDMDSYSIYIELSSGMVYLFSAPIENRLAVGSDMSILTMSPAENSIAYQAGIKFLGENYVPLSNSAKTIVNMDYSYTAQKHAENDKVTLDLLRSLSPFKVMLWEGHGGYNKKGEPETRYGLFTGEKVDKNKERKDPSLNADLKTKRVLTSNSILNPTYAITSKFVDKYFPQLNDAFIYLGTCYSIKDTTFATSLNNKGAAAVWGFNKMVRPDSEMDTRNRLIQYLCSYQENLNNFPSVQDAYQNCFLLDDVNKLGMVIFPSNASIRLKNVPSFSGGKGTINDPYQIATAEQLDAVRYNLTSNFVLVNDIDLSEYENWVPIGGMLDVKASDGFQGAFDGKGHTIKNLKMEYEIEGDEEGNRYKWHFGLFSNTQSSPGIKNINLEDVNISIKSIDSSSKDINIGSIATESSIVTNCKTSGIIRVSGIATNLSMGGIVVRTNRITDCTNRIHMIAATDKTNMNIGGIACIVVQDTLISNCDNFGNISGFSTSDDDVNCGGIVAYNNGTNITNCKNSGSIEASNYNAVWVGGIIAKGYWCEISNCSNTGNLSGRTYSVTGTNAGSRVGGIIADLEGHRDSKANLSKCVNFGNLTSISTHPNKNLLYPSWCGGIVGDMGPYLRIENCYNASTELNAISRNSEQEGKPYIGRICGYLLNEIDEILSNNYSFNTTTLNGSIPTENIGPDQKNGGSMTKAEIEKAIQELGFELPGELPAAS